MAHQHRLDGRRVRGLCVCGGGWGVKRVLCSFYTGLPSAF
jgi:hypothetical protein